MRVRERNSIVELDHPISYGKGSAGSLTSHSYVGTDELMKDVPQPGFARLQAEGKIMIHDLEVTKTRRKSTPARIDVMMSHYADQEYKLWYRGDYALDSEFGFNPQLGIDDSIMDSLMNEATAAAHANAFQNDAMILATLGEAQKTIGFIADSLRAGVAILNGVRELTRNPARQLNRLARRFGGKAPRTVQQAWLGYRYGLRPLMYDIQNLEKALTGQRPFRHIAKALRTDFREATLVAPHGGSNIAVPGYYSRKPNIRLRMQDTQRISYYASAGLVLQSELSDISTLDRLGVKALTPSAWELVPYSFIVDWFWNTADYWSQFQPKPFKVMSGWKTRKTVDELRRVSNPGIGYGAEGMHFLAEPQFYSFYHDWQPTYSGGECSTETIRIEREQSTTPAAIPSLDIRLDVAKLVDLLALFSNLRK